MRGSLVVVVLVVSLALALLACSLFTSLDGFSQSDSGGAPADAAGSDSADTSADASVASGVDAGPDTATSNRPPCKPGDIVAPVVAFDFTPPPASQNGPSCNVDAVLVKDDVVAGLDRTSDGTTPQIAGVDVDGCLGVEFAETTPIASIATRMVAVGNACGKACTPNTTDGCGTGTSFRVFVGATRTALTNVPGTAITGGGIASTLKDYTFNAPPGIDVRVVVICRAPFGTMRDDIGVDVISGVCR